MYSIRKLFELAAESLPCARPLARPFFLVSGLRGHKPFGRNDHSSLGMIPLPTTVLVFHEGSCPWLLPDYSEVKFAVTLENSQKNPETGTDSSLWQTGAVKLFQPVLEKKLTAKLQNVIVGGITYNLWLPPGRPS